MQTKIGLQNIIKLKTLCVGKQFCSPSTVAAFPKNVLVHVNAFNFHCVAEFDQALAILTSDQDVDLIFVDGDDAFLSENIMFITQALTIRPKLPLVVFTEAPDKNMRHLMRAGAAWHFLKTADELLALPQLVDQHVFSPVNWDELFSHYASDAVKPRIEPGLSYDDVAILRQNPEEQYIIKRLFANSDVVQIFRMDQGFSGSRIYTVKPSQQLKRILKIEVADQLELVQQKQEQLIQPRLNRRVGQIQGQPVRGQHLAGACYTLAGLNKEAITLSNFLLEPNRVRKEQIDKILDQLQLSLDQLNVGSGDVELRYWAPLYARVLPPDLVLAEAHLVEEGETADFTLSQSELDTVSSVSGNQTLAQISEALQAGQQPTLILEGFEVAELDTKQGLIYLHDDLLSRYPINGLLQGNEHPLLRFKIFLNERAKSLLTHPVFRRGKRVRVCGKIVASRDTILQENIMESLGYPIDLFEPTFELALGRFISPIRNIKMLLWEIGREDMIIPLPQISPVVHGDLNTNNILVEPEEHNVPVWLIDFSGARAGHTFYDFAKLEVEFRTHILFQLFSEMTNDAIWTMETGLQFALLLENVLLEHLDQPFETFIITLRSYQPAWYDALYNQFPLYFENLLYFLYSLRKMAKLQNPERFQCHYPVAIFFHSMSTLKYPRLDEQPWHPWAKRLSLCCGLVTGKWAVGQAKRPFSITQTFDALTQRSAFALIIIGQGNQRRYLLQWNSNWDMFNLIGGKLDNKKGDKNSFARTIQRELFEELALQSPRDYRLVRERKPLRQRQFSKRQSVFKDYEFHTFEIELLPHHPHTEEAYQRFARRISTERENMLVTRAEIERLRTHDNRPISETTRTILAELGELQLGWTNEAAPVLAFIPDEADLTVSRGKAQINGRLQNKHYKESVENILLEILPSPDYEVQSGSRTHHIERLAFESERPLTLWIEPKTKSMTLYIQATFMDKSGREHSQRIETPLDFQTMQSRRKTYMANPYVVGKPLTHASEMLYVGRNDIFSWIEENLLSKTQPHTLILYGQRRMGKTSTLYQLVEGQRGRTIREYPKQPIFPVYVDLQRLVGCNTAMLFERIAQLIVQALQKRGIQCSLPFTAADSGVYSAFDDFLDSVEKLLPQHGLLVVVFDELEQLQVSIEIGLLQQDILTYLRSLMQHRARLTFVLVGTNQLVEQYWSTLFHVGISREIDALSQKETEQLIREPVLPTVQYDDFAVDQIWLSTKGHPYFTQLICHRLISHFNMSGEQQGYITIEHVRETIAQTVAEDNSHLQYMWNECALNEQRILAVLAQRVRSAMLRQEIVADLAHVGIHDVDAASALHNLTQRGLVQRNVVERQLEPEKTAVAGWQPRLVSHDHAYTIRFDLLRLWISAKHPLGSLL